MEGHRRSRAWASIAIVAVLFAGGPAGTALADHAGDDREDVWHVSHTVNATVVDNYATVRVGVEIVNEGPDPEFPFRVALPEDAYVTGLTLTRDGETYEARVAEAEEARQEYEEAKDEHRSAGLVEQRSADDVYAYNVNVEGTETVEATLTYERYLGAEAGVYELELTAPATHRGVDEGATIEAHVQHSAGLEDVQASPDARIERDDGTVHVSRSVGPRGHGQATELRVGYELAQTQPGGALEAVVEDGTGYFVHRFRADQAMERVPLDIALVLDTSGSMRGDKMAQLQQATRRLVDELEPSDRLHLTFFADDTEQPWQGFRSVDPNTTDEAFEAIDRARATGSTNIEAAIEHGLSPFEAEEGSVERLPVVVFLTDGRPTEGLADEEELRRLALETNLAAAHVFSLAFGHDADWGLVHGLAEDGHGLAREIEAEAGAEVALGSFLTALTSPVMRDVRLDHEDATETWRLGAPVLFAGSELVYVGTFDPNETSLEATVSARDLHGTRSWNVSEPVNASGASYVPDLVAYQRIQALEDEIRAEGGNQTLEQRVLEPALEHGFVTEQTSLVVDLPRQAEDEETMHPEGGAEHEQAATDTRPADGDSQAAREAPDDGEDGVGHPPAETHDPVETPAISVVGSLVATLSAAVVVRRQRS